MPANRTFGVLITPRVCNVRFREGPGDVILLGSRPEFLFACWVGFSGCYGCGV